MLFSELDKAQQLRAAKTAIGRFMVHVLKDVPDQDRLTMATEVGRVLHYGLQVAGPPKMANTPSRWAGYARGVVLRGEKASNRKWTESTDSVTRKVSVKICDYLVEHAYN